MTAFNIDQVEMRLAATEHKAMTEGAWPFNFYLRYTPFLWALGLLIPAAVVMLFHLVMKRWPRGVLINVVIISWLSIAVAQAVCSILTGLFLHQASTGFRNAISFTVTGWGFGAVALAVGNAWQLSNRTSARLTAYLGGYILLLAAIALFAHLGGLKQLTMMTPIGHLLPGGNATNFYASMTIFQSEDTLGEARTRLILFFPWATALGLGALGIALISSRAERLIWRIVGMSGGVVGVVFSWSRIAIAALLLIAGMLIFLKLPRYLQVLSGIFIAFILYGMSIAGLDPITLINDMHNAADRARAGSSIARELIYQKSWEGFLRSPWIGNGWIGESVHRTEMLPIGSHSTIYGVLYTGGVLTMTCYVIAMLITATGIGIGVWRSKGNPDQRDNCLVAFGIWLSLMIYSPYESLFSLTIPCLFILTWIGGVIPAAEMRSVPHRSQHFSGNVFDNGQGQRRARQFNASGFREWPDNRRELRPLLPPVTAFSPASRPEGGNDGNQSANRFGRKRAFRTTPQHRDTSL